MRLYSVFDGVDRTLRALPKAISFYRGSASLALIRTLRILLREGPNGVVRRINILTGGKQVGARSINLYHAPQPHTSEFRPKVSVIVPNFNHASHLTARLDSIYAQTYSNFEVILLDDYSSDDSVRILNEYAVRYAERTTTCFNSENSGGVFQQWRKGLALASGHLFS